ncbi:unnamed protein product [Adineta ricciae]|uniref:Uncharacterized protein n=1 Tax=Adineta ricciae TaxID=249248 RepID=A0A815Q4P6_ADIRI|nr:unnamed protein product [Adineta ricciae]CAF1457034.1 unnamed protein product [Adineta ricciae]
MMALNACWNFRVGQEFLENVAWPSVLRKSAHDRCYCQRCYSFDRRDTIAVAGYTYVIPRGWTRFAVDEIFFNHHDVWKTWLNCYHGTSIESAKSCVEHRQLLLPSDVTMHGKKLEIREGHVPGEHYVFTTPSISYAALDCYAHTYDFRSPYDSKLYTIKVALQCKQKADSILVQPETVGARVPVEPRRIVRDPSPSRTAETTIPIPSRAEPKSEDTTKKCSIIRDDIVFLVLFIIVNLLPIALLIVGQIHKYDCPVEPWIPQWMTIFGAVSIGSFSVMLVMGSIASKWRSPYATVGVAVNLIFMEILPVFFFGGIWVFPVKSKVQHDQPNEVNYCEGNLYKFAFGFLITIYALIVLVPLCIGIGKLVEKLRKCI